MSFKYNSLVLFLFILVSGCASVSNLEQSFQNNDPAAYIWIDGAQDINQHTDSGETALHLAAKANNLQLVSYLLERNADPNIYSADGFLRSASSPLLDAVSNDNTEIARLLLAPVS